MPNYVQSASSIVSGTAVTLAFGSNNSQGNLLLAFVGVYTGNGPFSDPTISDTNGNKWVRITNALDLGDITFNSGAYLFAAYNCRGGANTVQVNINLSSSLHITLLEYSGCASVQARDQAYGATLGFGTSGVDSGLIDTQFNNEVIVSFSLYVGSLATLSPSSGWTQRQANSIQHGIFGFTGFACWDQLVTSTGAYRNTVSSNQGQNALHVLIASFSDTPNPDYLVQASQAAITSASPSIQFLSPNSIGNCLLLAISRRASAIGAISSVSDSQGNIWTLLGQTTPTSGAGSQSQLHLYVCNGCRSGINTVNISLPGSEAVIMIVAEYSSLTLGSAFEFSTNSSQSLSSGSIGVTASPKPALAISLAFDQSTSTSLYTNFTGTGWKMRMIESGSGDNIFGSFLSLSDQIIMSTQVIQQTITVGSGTSGLHFILGLGNSLFPSGGQYIPDLQLQLGPATQLYNHYIPSSQIELSENYAEGRASIVLDFNNGDGVYARDLGCAFGWPTNSHLELYVFQPTIIPEPEGIYDRATDWDNGGTDGAKFVQGAMVEAFSFGNAKTFFLQDSDTLTLHPLNECPVAFSKQQIKAFSCAPFIAHSCRLISTDGVEWKIFKSQLVFQPWPEATENWQTELTSLGMAGWGHAREINLAYISTSQITLSLTFDAWPTINLTVPSSGGVQSKLKITMPANKFKLIGFQASSSFPFRVFEDDVEVKIRQWGSSGTYTVLKPFGGKSSAGALV